jgi:Ca2+/Na+ antiporter
MKCKLILRSNYFRIVLILILILIPVYLIFFLKSASGNNADDEEKPKALFQGYMYDRFIPEFLAFSDTGLYSSYIEFTENDNTQKHLFLVRKNPKEIYITPDENCIIAESKSRSIPLMKIDYPFLNRKDNLYPYLNPELAIKMLHILNKVNYVPRFSDAMRSDEQQNKYKRRGWSNVSRSPHMLGLAFDIGRFSYDEKIRIKKLTEDLGAKFLQHGGKRNNHIHVQEQKIWESIEDKINIDSVSTALTKKILSNFNFVEIHKPVSEGIQPETVNQLHLSFYTEKNSILRIVIKKSFHEKVFEMTTGVFDGARQKNFSLCYDFLPVGNYLVYVYLNNRLLLTKTLVKI